MKLPSFSIVKLMSVVALVAINLGIARILFAYSPLLPEGMALTALALQAACFFLIVRRGRGRAFWTGFLIFGLIAMITFIWGVVNATNVGIAFDPVTGSTVKITMPGSPLWTVWSSYAQFMETMIVEQLHCKLDDRTGTIAALILSLPQLLLALIGGWQFQLIFGRRQKAAVSRTAAALTT